MYTDAMAESFGSEVEVSWTLRVAAAMGSWKLGRREDQRRAVDSEGVHMEGDVGKHSSLARNTLGPCSHASVVGLGCFTLQGSSPVLLGDGPSLWAESHLQQLLA